MTDPQRLGIVRGVHTLIYIVMATSTLLLVYAGLSRAQGWWLWTALALQLSRASCSWATG